MKLIVKERNATVAAMELAGARMDRETYLYWMSGGEITRDAELDAEVEALLPAQFRRDALDTEGGRIQ
jgi:hypothetical protein